MILYRPYGADRAVVVMVFALPKLVSGAHPRVSALSPSDAPPDRGAIGAALAEIGRFCELLALVRPYRSEQSIVVNNAYRRITGLILLAFAFRQIA